MNKAVFFRVLDSPNKELDLQVAIEDLSTGHTPSRAYYALPETFEQIPGSPFAYWVSEEVRRQFSKWPRFESEKRSVRVGLQTSDDFRFLRMWTEINPSRVAVTRADTLHSKPWVAFAKGGSFSPFYSDLYLLVNWAGDGRHLSSFHASVIRNDDQYFKPALTWPLRASRFAPSILPAGAIFSVRGYAVIASEDVLLETLGIGNSAIFDFIFKLVLGRFEYPEFIVGMLQKLPMPDVDSDLSQEISRLSTEAFEIKRNRDYSELSHSFRIPALASVPGSSIKRRASLLQKNIEDADSKLKKIERRLDEIALKIFNLPAMDEALTAVEHKTLSDVVSDEERIESLDRATLSTTECLISYCFGVIFGRWDVRMALDPNLIPGFQKAFAPLPPCPPGMLLGPSGLPACNGEIVSESWLVARPDVLSLPASDLPDISTVDEDSYPARVAWDGVLVDDPQDSNDIVRRVVQILAVVLKDPANEMEREVCDILGVRELRDYLTNPRRFFDAHLKEYSRSRRLAPIYWPLSTSSGSYTIWLYYPRLTSDTIYTAVNKYLNPKIVSVDRSIAEKSQSLVSASGGTATRLQRELEGEQGLRRELIDMRDELLRIAALPYRPNLDDGVIINAAPFHRLFRHRAWAKATEDTWKKLEKGEYDWAHLAYTIWPDRVRDVCRTDKSIAIAHGLEDLYVEAPVTAKKGKGRARQRALTEEDA